MMSPRGQAPNTARLRPQSPRPVARRPVAPPPRPAVVPPQAALHVCTSIGPTDPVPRSLVSRMMNAHAHAHKPTHPLQKAYASRHIDICTHPHTICTTPFQIRDTDLASHPHPRSLVFSSAPAHSHTPFPVPAKGPGQATDPWRWYKREDAAPGSL